MPKRKPPGKLCRLSSASGPGGGGGGGADGGAGLPTASKAFGGGVLGCRGRKIARRRRGGESETSLRQRGLCRRLRQGALESLSLSVLARGEESTAGVDFFGAAAAPPTAGVNFFGALPTAGRSSSSEYE